MHFKMLFLPNNVIQRDIPKARYYYFQIIFHATP